MGESVGVVTTAPSSGVYGKHGASSNCKDCPNDGSEWHDFGGVVNCVWATADYAKVCP